MRVRVTDHHRIAERRGVVGKVVGRNGGEEHVVVDVRFADGRKRLSGREIWRKSSPHAPGGAPFFLIAKGGASDRKRSA
jgi:hypothetical protein